LRLEDGDKAMGPGGLGPWTRDAGNFKQAITDFDDER
jgi:hypothetical protein